MKSSRRLALRREALTELTTDELVRAAAGGVPTLEAGCSTDDVTERVETVAWKLSLHQRCTWSCI